MVSQIFHLSFSKLVIFGYICIFKSVMFAFHTRLAGLEAATKNNDISRVSSSVGVKEGEALCQGGGVVFYREWNKLGTFGSQTKQQHLS